MTGHWKEGKTEGVVALSIMFVNHTSKRVDKVAPLKNEMVVFPHTTPSIAVNIEARVY